MDVVRRSCSEPSRSSAANRSARRSPRGDFATCRSCRCPTGRRGCTTSSPARTGRTTCGRSFSAPSPVRGSPALASGNESGEAFLGTYMTTIGLIGSGNIGSTVARLAVDAGYDVVLSNSRGPGTLTDLVAQLGPRARAGTAAEAAAAGEIVVVTIPLRAYREVPVAPLVGKVVIDTNNYYPQRDEHIAELDNGSTTSSELLQAHLPESRVV